MKKKETSDVPYTLTNTVELSPYCLNFFSQDTIDSIVTITSYMVILFTSRSKQLSNWQTVFLVCVCSASFPCQDKPFWTQWQESKYMEIGFQQSHCYPSWWTTVQNCTNKSFPSAFQELALHGIAHTRPRMSMSFVPAFFLFDIV